MINSQRCTEMCRAHSQPVLLLPLLRHLAPQGGFRGVDQLLQGNRAHAPLLRQHRLLDQVAADLRVAGLLEVHLDIAHGTSGNAVVPERVLRFLVRRVAPRLVGYHIEFNLHATPLPCHMDASWTNCFDLVAARFYALSDSQGP
eukprot:UN4922